MFFPGKGGSTERARQICARCPVVAECREYALREARGRYFTGVWAGLSARELTEIARKRPIEADQREHERAAIERARECLAPLVPA